MPTTKIITLYTFDELNSDAKEQAREWWRVCETQDFETDFMFEDFERVAEILGIELKTHAVNLYGGGTRQEPNIWFSGFSSQGDGACFEGWYRYAKGAARKIRDYAPKDKTLHAIADSLQQIQKPALYGLTATISHRGQYFHAHSTTIDVDRDSTPCPTGDESETVAEQLHAFMNWMYRQLESEYFYRLENEQVDESILANDYTFNAIGNRESMP